MIHYVLDACALVALFKGEEGAADVDDLFQKTVRGDALLYMSIVNLLEVYYGFIRDIGLAKTTEMMQKITDTPLNVIDAITQNVYHKAAYLKGTYQRLSLADALGVATAIEHDAVFVTSDHHELETVEQKESLKFYWFR